jgi:hypothetical protein
LLACKDTFWCTFCEKSLFFPNVYKPLGTACHPSPCFLTVTHPLFLQSHGMNFFRFSRMDRRVAACSSSILPRLFSRSITRHDAPVQVHQHGNFELLVLECSGLTENYLRRRFFFASEIDAFCNDLIRGGSLGVYSCVSHPHSPPDSVEPCFRTNRADFSTAPLADGRCGVCFKIIPVCVCPDRNSLLYFNWPKDTQ